MANVTTSALTSGASQALTIPATWSSYTVTYTCSSLTDPGVGVSVYGSADGGTTWVLLPVYQNIAVSGGTGANIYARMPVNAIKVQAHCSDGNTVTASVAGI